MTKLYVLFLLLKIKNPVSCVLVRKCGVSSGKKGKAQPWVALVLEASRRTQKLENRGFLTEAEAGSERGMGPHNLLPYTAHRQWGHLGHQQQVRVGSPRNLLSSLDPGENEIW